MCAGDCNYLATCVCTAGMCMAVGELLLCCWFVTWSVHILAHDMTSYITVGSAILSTYT